MLQVRARLRGNCVPVSASDGATWLVSTSAAEELAQLAPEVAQRLRSDPVGTWRDAYARGEVCDDLVREQADGGTLGPPVAERLGELGPSHRRTLLALAEPVQLAGDDGELVGRLSAGGWLETSVGDQHPAYLVRPVGVPGRRPARPADPVLSRFALLRRNGSALVLASPLAWCEIDLWEPALLAVLAGAPPGDEVARRLVHDLCAAGLMVDQAEPAECVGIAGRWSPHDLWFHARTRSNPVRDEPFGPVPAGPGHLAPTPARHRPFTGPPNPLHRPPPAAPAAGRPAAGTLETRRSVRRHDDDSPMTADQLGEFLFRCGRNRWLVEKDGVEYVSRPYPSASSGYELEVYPLVRQVRGLEKGLYHYDAQEHTLRSGKAGIDPPMRRLLRLAATMATMPGQPQVLLIMTARFGRVMAGYDAIAYALVAKHVGVLQQVMYMVGTELGLAPCALGTGDSATFAAAAGLDPLHESSVGEFILGSRPTAGGVN